MVVDTICHARLEFVGNKVKQFNYEELKEYVSNYKGRLAVVMTATECGKCDTMLNYVEGKLIPKYPSIEFVNFNTDDVPLFAPPAFPSIVFFRNEYRSHEGHGLPEPIEAIDNVIDWWINTVL